MNTRQLFFLGHETHHSFLWYSICFLILFLWSHTPPKILLSPPQLSYRLPLNQASKEELLCVPGLGERRVQQILWAREQKGTFNNLEELAEIKGIGPRLIQKLSLFLLVP